jgi:hypothetical protein
MWQNGSLDDGEPTRSPYARTWHLGRFLRNRAQERGWDFRYVNLDDTTPVTIGKDDIVIGHLWFNNGSFMQQALKQDCRAKFAIQPYTHRMVGDEMLPTLREYFEIADHLFFVTGPYWWDTMPESPFAEWQKKATRLDNSVNTTFHKFQKHTWNRKGERGFMCIGYDNPVKGLDRIAELARVSGLRLGVFGHMEPFKHVPHCTMYGGMHFTHENVEWLCKEYDFFLSMGRFDANPTTLNETASWGIIGACTTGSGYWPNAPYLELRDDLQWNLELIDRLQNMDETDLNAHAAKLREIQEQDYTWDKLVNTVWNKVQEWL